MNSQFRTLVAHFFNRFFDVDSTSSEVDSRGRVIQLLTLLTVPGLMISFFLMGDHPSGSTIFRAAFSETDRMWLRVGDRYVFVCYAMTAMGLLMALKWDSLFPDRRDYLILSSLPISRRRWFFAKLVALAAFLGLFVVAINFFSLLLRPPIVAFQSRAHTPAAFFSAFMAHAAGTIGGSIFAALFFAALQGVLINVLPANLFRRLSPAIQMVSIATLVTIFLVIPLVKDSIPQLAQKESPLLDYLPLMWFLGLYEALIPGGSVMPRSIVWARTAINATAAVGIVFMVSYFLGYRRYSKKVLESIETETMLSRQWKGGVAAILDRFLVRNPVERGTFHFIDQVSSRSARHRIMTALYGAIGIALAVSSLFVLDRRATSFPFRLSTKGAIEAPLIIIFILVSGLRAVFNVPSELSANWIFQLPGAHNASHFLRAVRKWIFVYRIVPFAAVAAVFEFVCFDATTAVLHVCFDLLIAAFLIEAFFYEFNKVPFTCSYSANKMQLAALAAVYLYGFTTFVEFTGNVKAALTRAPLRMAVFAGISLAVLAMLERRRRAVAITYDGNEAGLLSLSEDRGYWRESRAAVSAVTPATAGAYEIVAGVAKDFRYGFRIIWKSPALALTAAGLIGLVIGLNTTVYSIVHAFITRPAPGVHAKDLVLLSTAQQRAEPFHSYPEYLEFSQAKTVQSLVAYGVERMTFGTREGSTAMFGSFVTPNYFDGLGAQIVRGRGFNAADDGIGGGLVAVISHRVWQEQFRGDESVIGRSVTVNGMPGTVIGVAEPLFQGAELAVPDDVWVPAVSYFSARGRAALLAARADGGFGFLAIGRLKPNVSLGAAQAEFAAISARLQAEYPSTNRNKVVRPIPYSATVNAGISQGAPQFLAVFSVITTMTLIIVCANVANLLLARAVVRQRETAVRRSLGASRGRIVRTLLAEGLAISAVAWALASLFALWTSTYVPRLLVPSGSMNGLGMRPNHMNMDLSPDFKVLAYAMLLAVVGTIFFCIAPALRMWSQELLPGLKTGEHGVVRGRSKLTGALVVVQLALSVVLLTSAGVATRSLSLLDSLDAGYNQDNLLLVTLNPTLVITNRDANLAFLERLRERLQKIAGVQSVSYVRLPPPYSVQRRPVGNLRTQKPIVANVNYVGPDYLRVLGLKPILGREFDSDDAQRARPAALVNQELAETLWPGRSALGQTIPINGGRDFAEVIGVTPNVLFSHRKESYFVFLSEQQDRARVTGQAGLFTSGETTFYLRYAGNLDAIGPAIRGIVRQVDERVPVINMRTMQAQLDRGHADARTLAAFLSLFSGGSLLVAALGQYAAIAFEMKRRTRELGIRVAMGASSRQIQVSVLREGLMLTGLGLLIGFALSLATGLALRSFLTDITPTDVPTYSGVFIILGITSLLACYLPARRASRTDPLVTLRYE